MISPSESTPEDEYEDANTSYENPNYRKLYAALSMKTMMGQHMQRNDACDDCQTNDDDTDGRVHNDNDGNDTTDELPLGWERHEDDNGPYYWHIPSGTIQREIPSDSTESNPKRDSLIYYHDDADNDGRAIDTSNDNECSTFMVHSLGWTEFDERQLTPALSSKAIQKCIMELTTKGDNNAVRCWGRDHTQQLVLTIDNCHLKLYDVTRNTLLVSQPICGIKVWGVNDNNEFAYVARDTNVSPLLSKSESTNSSPILKCHVFHCEDDDTAAQQIATSLKDEMIQLKMNAEMDLQNPKVRNERPKHLFIYDNKTPSPIVTSPTAIEFPTPIEEPRKTLFAKYLGKIKVKKPMGIDILNDAIQNVLLECNKSSEEIEEFEESPLLMVVNADVYVHISPSNIIVESSSDGESIVECRVRYLSFLGISEHNVKHCGFIMQIDENDFEAHCFECEPSSGALCKTIEAACKLRYQKCLDAHRQRCNNETTILSPNQQSGIKSTIKNVFSKILKT